jgi:hypothetical protein
MRIGRGISLKSLSGLLAKFVKNNSENEGAGGEDPAPSFSDNFF